MDKQQLKISVLKWHQGDVASFSVLYDFYVDKIYRFIFFKVPFGEAEDLTEDVFLKVMQKKHTFDPDKSAFSTWIYTIARNTVIDFLRTSKSVSELNEFIEDTDSNKDIVNNLDKNFELLNLKKAISVLPKDKQDLVVLRFIDELSYEEMAQILQKSEGSIRISMMRTLKELRVILEKLET